MGLEQELQEERASAGRALRGLEWVHFTHPLFRAEYAPQGKDIIYHLFPPAGQRNFYDKARFALRTERAFKRVFPRGADVRAEFVSGKTTELARRADGVQVEVGIEVAPMGDTSTGPQDSWHITAVGWGDRPGVIRFAGERLMHLIVEELRII